MSPFASSSSDGKRGFFGCFCGSLADVSTPKRSAGNRGRQISSLLEDDDTDSDSGLEEEEVDNQSVVKDQDDCNENLELALSANIPPPPPRESKDETQPHSLASNASTEAPQPQVVTPERPKRDSSRSGEDKTTPDNHEKSAGLYESPVTRQRRLLSLASPFAKIEAPTNLYNPPNADNKEEEQVRSVTPEQTCKPGSTRSMLERTRSRDSATTATTTTTSTTAEKPRRGRGVTPRPRRATEERREPRRRERKRERNRERRRKPYYDFDSASDSEFYHDEFDDAASVDSNNTANTEVKLGEAAESEFSILKRVFASGVTNLPRIMREDYSAIPPFKGAP